MRVLTTKAARLVIVSGLVLVLSVSFAHAAPILNGSFETPTVTPGMFSLFTVGAATLTNWSVVGPALTNVGIVSETFSQNGVSFPAQDGHQWLDLTGLNSNSTEGVAQSVATTVGNVYQLSYFVGNTTGGGIFGTTSTVNVLVNGVQTFSDTNSTMSPTTQSWQQFTHNFTATASTTTLTFLNGDPGSDNDNGLDNVVLTDLGPAQSTVPEPTSLALLASGLLGIGFFGRRHSK
jgi:uncharacterized protein DUF642/PEP-CTERM motif-containing protein